MSLPVRKFTNVVDKSIKVQDVTTILVDVPATTTVEVRLTLDPSTDVAAETVGTFSFANTNPDTITRTSGSFIVDGFKAGMQLAVSGSASNNSTFTIASVTATTLTLDPANALTTEGPTANVTLEGRTPNWFLDTTITGQNHLYKFYEFAPTGLRFVRTAGTGNVRVWIKG